MSEPPESLERLAAMLDRQGRRDEAIDAYRRLLAEHPERPDAWYNLGVLLRSAGRFGAALEAYGRALEEGARDPWQVHLNRAAIYADHLRRDDAAEAELRAALTRHPNYFPAWLNLGNLHEERGRGDEAATCYERILSSDGVESGLRYEALARLAQLRPPKGPADPLLGNLRGAAAGADCQGLVGANICFALGRACDAVGSFDEAFSAFVAANRIARGLGPPYDRHSAERRFSEVAAVFGAVMQSREPEGRPADELEPIFICGMYRSGSTLAEQVLAAHPRVIAGGELELLPRLVADSLSPFPAAAASLGPLRARRLARHYRDELRRLFPQRSGMKHFVTDKRPDNFLLVGLILRLFPKARIIHTVRHPLDNCLSIYFQHLDQRALGYSSDLADIGHYYGLYRRLMNHWKICYPANILDFSYDEFVLGPERPLRRLLEFLDFDWDDRCLAFHELGNTVKTASYWQVRRPLYRESSGRWRRYSNHLGPLREALSAAGLPEAELSLGPSVSPSESCRTQS